MRNSAAAGLPGLRDRNARGVLELLLDNPQGVTQREIAKTLGLARSTVSTLISEELQALLTFEECGEPQSDRGPPARVWSVARDAAYSLGLDIGRSHVSVAIADPYGEIVAGPKSIRLTETLEDPAGTFDEAWRLIDDVVGSSPRYRRPVAITVGLPGIADNDRGLPADAGAAWAAFDVPAEVEARWPSDRVPDVLVENDANLGALGEFHRGAGRQCGSVLFIKWSTEIGSGIIINGKLWTGGSRESGKLGHLTVNPTKAQRRALRLRRRSESLACPHCGRLDCIERTAGGLALANAVDVNDSCAVLQEARDARSSKQELARDALDTAARLIGNALGPALALLDVERVVLGGLGGEDAYPRAVRSLREGIEKTAPPQTRADLDIRASALGRNAYVVGAAIEAFKRKGVTLLLASATAARRETPDCGRASLAG